LFAWVRYWGRGRYIRPPLRCGDQEFRPDHRQGAAQALSQAESEVTAADPAPLLYSFSCSPSTCGVAVRFHSMETREGDSNKIAAGKPWKVDQGTFSQENHVSKGETAMEEKNIDFAAIPQTAVKVLTSPLEFFRQMPKAGGFIEPLVFMVVMGVVTGLLMSILSVLRLQVGAGMAMGVGSVILMPIMVAIFGFVGAAILFLIWKLMGSQESYETAYRCGAYIGALSPISVLLHFIPYLGGAASVLLMTFFLVTASIAVHNIPSRKAWLVFGIIGGLLVLFNISAEITARRFMREGGRMRIEAEEASKMMRMQAEQLQKQAEETSRMLQKQSEEAARQMRKQAGEAP
jgi:hypothetical protein